MQLRICLTLCTDILPKICFQKLIGQKLNFLFATYSDLSSFKCPIHNLKEIIKLKVAQFVLFNYCKKTNKILRGLDRNIDKSISTNCIAYNYYLKHKGNKNKK